MFIPACILLAASGIATVVPILVYMYTSSYLETLGMLLFVYSELS